MISYYTDERINLTFADTKVEEPRQDRVVERSVVAIPALERAERIAVAAVEANWLNVAVEGVAVMVTCGCPFPALAAVVETHPSQRVRIPSVEVAAHKTVEEAAVVPSVAVPLLPRAEGQSPVEPTSASWCWCPRNTKFRSLRPHLPSIHPVEVAPQDRARLGL